MPATQSKPRGANLPPRNAVAAARQRAGLTQPQLAVQVGVSRGTIARIEAGETSPSVALALKLADALGQSVETLFSGDAKGGE
jgi:putative transcriptional regulator